MKHIRIENEFLRGPLWFYDENWELENDPFDIVKNDQITMELKEKASDLYSSYFDLDALEKFHIGLEKEHAHEMLDIITKLKKRVEEINDGSYDITDYETEKLLQILDGTYYEEDKK